MNGQGLFLTGVEMLVLAVVFVILYLVIVVALRKMGPFSPMAQHVLAICVSLLAVIGFAQLLSGSGGSKEDAGKSGWLDFVLLPYIALAIALLLALLIGLFARALSRGPRDRETEEPRKQSRLRKPDDKESGSLPLNRRLPPQDMNCRIAQFGQPSHRLVRKPWNSDGKGG